jgi:ABC-type lipoprotein release transport system permease subunit
VFRWFLSLRYLRARRTNWIGVAGIFVAVAALILILSIMAGFLSESRQHLRGNLADVLIMPRMNAPIVSTGQLPRANPEPLLETLRGRPGVAGATVQLQWYGLLMREGRGFGRQVMEHPLHGDLGLVSLVGIDVENEYTTSDLRESLSSQPPPSSPVVMECVDDVEDPFAMPEGFRYEGLPPPSILLGAQLANSLGLHRGDVVHIVTSSIDPVQGEVQTPSNQQFVIAGFFRTGENEMDLERVYVEREELADFLDRGVDWSQAMVRLDDYARDNEAVVADLRQVLHEEGYLHHPEHPFFNDREVVTWETFRGNLLGAIENEKSLMGIMLSLVMLVAGFTIFAIHSMLIAEKRRDIGILCALGATPQGILTTFLLIGCWEVLAGAALGTAAGVVAALNIDGLERWLSSTFGLEIFNRDVYLFDHIPSVIEVGGVSMIVAGAVAVTLFFSAIPAWRAARLDPIEALRSE